MFVEVVVIGETLLPKEEGDCNPKECAVVAMSAAVSDDSGDMRVLVMMMMLLLNILLPIVERRYCKRIEHVVYEMQSSSLLLQNRDVIE